MCETCNVDDHATHSCGDCGMQYAEKQWAEKCEAWCKEHHTCNLKIIQHAVESEVVKG
ncbi:MAG: hypothetical protein AAB420_03365 [Patescibacteria group bacterium]